MFTVNLPDPGEGLLEADITQWLVEVGQVVAVNDPVVEIETAKSLVELPAPVAGVVAELLVAVGDTVPVGSPIMRIGTPVEVRADTTAEVRPQGASKPATDDTTAEVRADTPAGDTLAEVRAERASKPGTPHSSQAPTPQGARDAHTSGTVVPEPQTPGAEEAQALLVGYGAAASSLVRRPRKGVVAQPAEQRERVQESYATDHPVSRRTDHISPLHPSEDEASERPLPGPGHVRDLSDDGGRPLATPVVRRLARDLGIDLRTVTGTGPDGQILPADVAGEVGAAAGTRRPTPPTRIPLKGVRRAMVQSMTASVETPQASIWLDVDVSSTVDLIGSLKQRREFENLRISPILVLAKAVCLAIARHPEINSTLMLDRDEIVLHPDVNLGIAAATTRGLVVPNVKRAQEMNLLELAQALNDLVTKARDGKITPADCAGGTFSITNVGVFGVEGGTPILNPGESAILCLGKFNRRPWVVGTGEDEQLVPRWVATLALTIDHRVLDGEQGSRFLADVATILSDPGLALLF